MSRRAAAFCVAAAIADCTFWGVWPSMRAHGGRGPLDPAKPVPMWYY